jgi:hypothetical protein
MGGVAVDQDGGWTEGEGSEMRANQLDIAEGQSGCGNDVVDARIGEDFSGGLGAGAGHFLDLFGSDTQENA